LARSWPGLVKKCTVLWGEKVEGVEDHPDLFTHLVEGLQGIFPTAAQQVGDGQDGSLLFD
jgi:hypothetical protein